MSRHSKYPSTGFPGVANNAPAPPVTGEDIDDEDDAPVIPPAPPVAAPRVPNLYRVVAQKRISWSGHVTQLAEGQVVAMDAYGGPPGIAKLREQGVELVPLE